MSTLAAGCLLTAGAVLAPVLFADDFTGTPVGVPWPEGGTVGGWRVVYSGYGRVAVERSGERRVLRLRPKAGTEPDETHAALVRTRRSFGDSQTAVDLRTVRQLRTGSPANPWESAWLLWHYTDSRHFYYLAFKPNGWELGKADPAYPGGQRFLATGSSPAFPVGSGHHVRVRQVAGHIAAWVDGHRLTVFVDTERAYLAGAVGIYTEDAEIEAAGVRVTTP